MTETLLLNAITADARAQSRAAIDMIVVNEYAEEMQSGADFPPMVVFFDGHHHWLSEGFHRYHAYKQNNTTSVNVVIHPGGLREATPKSLSSNISHGLRRSNADKRRAVEIMLNDEEWSQWGNREIARQCGVDEKTVRASRESHCGTSAVRTYTTKHGTTAVMKTSNIGRQTKPNVEPTPELFIPVTEPESKPFTPTLVSPKPELIEEDSLVESPLALLLRQGTVTQPAPLPDQEQNDFKVHRQSFFYGLNFLLSHGNLVSNPADWPHLNRWYGSWDLFEQQFMWNKADAMKRLLGLQKNLPILIETLEKM